MTRARTVHTVVPSGARRRVRRGGDVGSTVQTSSASAGAQACAGGAIGFAIAAAGMTAGLLLTGADPVIAWVGGVLTGLWGGATIGATVGLSRHAAAAALLESGRRHRAGADGRRDAPSAAQPAAQPGAGSRWSTSTQTSS
jgi:hypothetical protein